MGRVSSDVLLTIHAHAHRPGRRTAGPQPCGPTVYARRYASHDGTLGLETACVHPSSTYPGSDGADAGSPDFGDTARQGVFSGKRIV